MLLGENLSHDVSPPVRDLLTDMPEEIAKDQRNGVEKVASTALANELIPVRQIPVAAAKYREADFSADVDGEPLGDRQKTPARKIARTLKRSDGATRQKAFSLGVSLDSRV